MPYEAPVLRRLSLQVGVSALVAVLIATLIGAMEGSPYAIATTLGISAFVSLVIIVHRMTPSRIELQDDEVRLIAPQATTRYAPNAMRLRADPSRATFALGRRKRTFHLAVFRDPDIGRVKQVFESAGVSVVGAERIP
jgi:hypothetical protein